MNLGDKVTYIERTTLHRFTLTALWVVSKVKNLELRSSNSDVTISYAVQCCGAKKYIDESYVNPDLNKSLPDSFVVTDIDQVDNYVRKLLS